MTFQPDRLETAVLRSLYKRVGQWVPTKFFGGQHVDRLVFGGYVDRRHVGNIHELRLTPNGEVLAQSMFGVAS